MGKSEIIRGTSKCARFFVCDTTELVKEANLENPFESGTISNIVPELKKYIDSVDTSKF